jgi:hypothetical protein
VLPPAVYMGSAPDDRPVFRPERDRADIVVPADSDTAAAHDFDIAARPSVPGSDTAVWAILDASTAYEEPNARQAQDVNCFDAAREEGRQADKDRAPLRRTEPPRASPSHSLCLLPHS